MRLVFLHAAGSSGDQWVQQRLAFAARHEVATPDLPGHGSSAEAPLERIEDIAAWVARTQAVERAVVVGHSMGAAVALALAASHPVRGLVLVGAASRLPVPAGFVEEVARDPAIAAERLATAGFASGARAGLVDRASAFLTRTDPEVLARDFAASSAFDARDLLARIRVPTRVIVGAEDRMTPLADAEAMARGIAGAELHVVPGAGHMVMLERPREFNAALASFLDRLR